MKTTTAGPEGPATTTTVTVPPLADIPPGYIKGTDGKVYPYRRLTTEQRAGWVGRVHYLRHTDGLSTRDILNTLRGEGFYVSVGTVHAWLKTWRCSKCSGGPKTSPEHSTVDQRNNCSAGVGR